LSFSLDRWTGVWRSRHHVMSQFSKSMRVLYVDPATYVGDLFGRPSPRRSNRPTGVSRIAADLYTYVPPRWLPDSYRYPKLDRAIKHLRYAQIRHVMRRLGMARPILYIWHPDLLDVVGKFDESLVVYHVYDDYSSFHMTDEQRQRLAANEAALLARADVVFASSEEQRERRLASNPNTYLVRNGVDYALFSRARAPDCPIPDDLRSIEAPVIGCVTTQTPFMDLTLLREIFERRPDWSFVFIGVERTAEETADESLRALQRLPNVHFIGRRRLEEMPGYLKGCAVCVIPWLLNGVTLASSSPLKLYEYLAAGKPVVCKPTPLLMQMAGLVSFATTASEWIATIEAAIEADDADQVARRQAAARENTWERRVDFISQTLATALSGSRRKHRALASELDPVEHEPAPQRVE
jgi:glycosyltransferase involved in cell wall biosynthesis